MPLFVCMNDFTNVFTCIGVLQQEGWPKDSNSYEAQQQAWYQYYQQHPEAQAQYMAQWQQMQAQAAQYYGYDANQQGGGGGGNWNRGGGGGAGGYGYGGGGGGGYGGDGGRRERSQPSNTLWVGNLTPEIREGDIRRAFEPYGAIESVRMLDAKNCAFVTYTNLESSKAAHANTYGLKINGVEVKINWGRPNAPQGGGGNGPHGGGYGGGGGGGGGGYGGPRDGGYGGGGPRDGGYGGRGGGYDGGYGGGGGFGGGHGGYGGGGPRGPRDDHNTPSPNIWVGNVDPNVTEHELRTCFDRFGAIDRVKLHPQKNCAFVNFVDLNSALAAKAEMNGFLLFGQALRVNFGKPRLPGGDRGDRNFGGGNEGGGRDYHQSGPHGSYGGGGDARSGYDSQARDGPHNGAGGSYGNSNNVATAPAIPVSEPQNVSQELKDMVDKLVEAFEKSPTLEEMTKQNQADNPKFAFLFPGREGHDYFLWKRYGSKAVASAAATNSASADISLGAGKFDATLPVDVEPLTANETEDLEGILRTLDSSKEKILAGAEFATTHAKKACAVAVAIVDYALNRIAPSQNVLHVVYLVNEIFNVVLRARANPGPDSADHLQLTNAFLPHLIHLLRAANSAENMAVLTGIIKRWKDSSFFTSDEISALENAFLAGEPNKKRKREGEEDVEDALDAKRPAPAPVPESSETPAKE